MKRLTGMIWGWAFVAAGTAGAALPPPGPPGMSPLFLRANVGARYEDETTPYVGFAVGFTPSPYVAFGMGLDFERLGDCPVASLKSSYSFAFNAWGFLPRGRWRPALRGQAGELAYTFKSYTSSGVVTTSETRTFISAAPGVSYKVSRYVGAGAEGGWRYHPPKGYRDGRTLYFGGGFVEFYW
jgi:hypothetical protein